MTSAGRPNELTQLAGDPSEPSAVICVLGMHRSGTSALAGCLQEAGLFLGDVNESHPHNLKGNRENQEIRQLNDDILAYNGGAWDDPPRTLLWDSTHTERAAAIVATHFSRHSVWGFKDPRTVLTLRFWRQALPNLKPVGTFRHPMAVAQSLFDRGGRPIQQSLRLWRYYNAIILEEVAKSPFACICFDLPDDGYLKQLSLIVSEINPGPRDATNRFFDAGLRHMGVPNADDNLDPEIRAIYAALCEVSFRVRRNATTI